MQPVPADPAGAYELHHMGIVVADIDLAAIQYDLLGFTDGHREFMPDQGVIAMTYRSGSGYVELIQPTDDAGPIARFMAKRGEGTHHIAYRVADLAGTLERLSSADVRLIDESPRTGMHGWRIAFIHPESCCGVLTELVDDRVEF